MEQHLEHLSSHRRCAHPLQRSKDSSFDNIIDSGVFQVFTDEQRIKYVDSLHFALRRDGKYFMLCFSES